MSRWLLLVGKVIFAGLLPFVVIEAGLRVVGWHPPDDPYGIDFDGHRPIFELHDGQWEVEKRQERYFRGEPFPAARDGHSLLFFSVGDSITWGYRGNEFQGPLASYSDVLQRLLRERLPGGEHRVINCGARTFASRRVLGVAKEAIEHHPDAIIGYFGSSEYLEDRLRQRSTAPSWLMKSRVVEGLARLIQRTGGEGGLSLGGLRERDASLQTRFLRPEALLTDPAKAKALAEQSARDVAELVAAAHDGNVPLVLTTVAANLRFPPFATWFSDPARRAAGFELIKQTEELITKGQAARARDLLLPALAASPEAAGLHYRLAQALDALGDHTGAHDQYIAACDTDAFPLRATTQFNEMIRRTARERPDVVLVDFEKLFEERVADHIPDDRMFLDDSHPNEAVHAWMAETLYKALAAAGWLQAR